MTMGMTDSVSQVCGGIYRRTSDCVIQLIRTISRNQDILGSENMHSSSASSGLSSSSSMCISTDSRSSSSSSKGGSKIDKSHQTMPTPSQRRRSTSLIEWKQAPSVKTAKLFNETGNKNVIYDNFFHLNHAATTYLDNYTSISDMRDLRLSTSASASKLPSTNPSTPDYSRSATTSRTNSVRTNCSCFSCSMHDHVSIGAGRSIPSVPKQRRPSQLIFDFQVRDFYDVLDVLGEGSFSTVYLAESLVEQGGYAAIKVIQKTDLVKTKKTAEVHKSKSQDSLYDDGVNDEDGLSSDEEEDLTWLIDREIRVMSELDHPHIVHLEEVYEDNETACFVLELAKGGEVFDRLIEKENLDEMDATNLVVQVLSAVAHIHEKGIVHRDLKLENLLYYDDTEDSRILVADFGLSDWETNLHAGSPVCGTPGYLAPEVIAREACTTASDVWAVGVVSYILLCGYPPFFAEPDEPDTDATILKKILKCHYEFHGRSWSNITDEAKDFIRTLLNPDPMKRPTCEEALLLPWLRDRDHLKDKIDSRIKETSSEEEADENSSLARISRKWSLSEMIAFSFSMFVILCSYATIVLYIFKVDLGLWSFLIEEWGVIHNETTDIVDSCIEGSIQCYDAIFEKSCDLVTWMVYNMFCSVVYMFV